ncbi:MAG: hypothetical protein GXO32_03685 [Crenarchaeota archaeon]|nr:hypothetical protein [Thermoproteota archaeon]
MLLATSEGVSRRKLLVHTYVHVYIMWNLPRDGFEELAKQLDPSVDLDTAWMLTGGNPRALIELLEYRWNVDRWMNGAVLPRVRVAVEGIDVDMLRALVDDPDCDPATAKLLEDRNTPRLEAQSGSGARHRKGLGMAGTRLQASRS